MKITYDPPALADELELTLRELIRENAVEMAGSRCATHGAAPSELRITKGTGSNLVDIEVIGCCDEYAIDEEE